MKLALLELLSRREPDTPRAEHHARILCGEIEVDGERVRDPRRQVDVEARVLRRTAHSFVSRAGSKLDGILADWRLSVGGLSLIDAGASTGGFTDCLLRRGALRVCAVEAGTNQLAYRLRVDPRVTVLERTNVMALTGSMIPFRPDAAVADLSLRSLRGAARHLLDLLGGGWLAALVKPQYEGLRAPAGGVLGRPEERLEVLRRLGTDLEREGVYVSRAGPSRVRGSGGNVEFFFLLTASAGRRLADLHGALEQLVFGSAR